MVKRKQCWRMAYGFTFHSLIRFMNYKMMHSLFNHIIILLLDYTYINLYVCMYIITCIYAYVYIIITHIYTNVYVYTYTHIAIYTHIVQYRFGKPTELSKLVFQEIATNSKY